MPVSSMAAKGDEIYADTHDAKRARSIAEAEHILRVELAAAYRLVDYFGWTEQIYGHLTARIPGTDNHFLINAFGQNYDEVTASSLVEIDVDGNVVSGENQPVSYAGFVIHSAIHMAHQAQNQVVMHIHSRAGMAIAAIKDGLLPISMFSTVFYENLGYHDYEGASLYLDERERIVRSLGSAKAMILRNHGLLVTGASVPECFLRLYRLERACQIQVDAAACGHIEPDQPSGRDEVPARLRFVSGHAARARRHGGVCGADAQARSDRFPVSYLKRWFCRPAKVGGSSVTEPQRGRR